MTIRDAKSTDVTEINKLSEALGYGDVTIEAAAYRLNTIINSSADKLWVYEDHNQLIGWIHLFVANRVASPSFVEIGGLVVSSDFRGSGIGRSLVEEAANWAKSKDLKIRVRCNVKRTETHKFYEAIGFKSTKSQHVFEGSL